MPSISITVFVSYLLLMLGAARAQISAPNCTDSSMDWSFNSLQQSPCLVGAYLQAVCNDSTFNIPALQPEQSYPGPTDGNLCNCNTVVYSLMSACIACQNRLGFSYPSWSYNCSSSAAPGVFPKPVPDGTRVPQWAYMDSFAGDTWDTIEANFVGDSPEVTGSVVMASASQFSFSPTSLASSSSSTFSPTASRSGLSSTFSHTASGTGSSSTSTSHTSSNRGKMEGSIVGGIVGATLIFGILVWFVRRRRARSAPSTTDTSGEMERPVYHPLTVMIKTPELYDPSDPTTYQKTEFQPQRLRSISHLQPGQVGYSGLPEI